MPYTTKHKFLLLDRNCISEFVLTDNTAIIARSEKHLREDLNAKKKCWQRMEWKLTSQQNGEDEQSASLKDLQVIEGLASDNKQKLKSHEVNHSRIIPTTYE